MKNKLNSPFLLFFLFNKRIKVKAFFATIYCKILFRVWGVRLEKGSTFYGVPIIYLHPGSKINVGKNIRVRTSPGSNLIGINRRTIIATHDEGAKLTIGDNCGFTSVVIGARESITIGNDVMVGANVLITDFDWHAIDPSERRHGIPASRPVMIEDNVFIGYGSSILKGVTIGKNSVIGANSVVTRNIPANVIAAGNPCQVIKVIASQS